MGGVAALVILAAEFRLFSWLVHETGASWGVSHALGVFQASAAAVVVWSVVRIHRAGFFLRRQARRFFAVAATVWAGANIFVAATGGFRLGPVAAALVVAVAAVPLHRYFVRDLSRFVVGRVSQVEMPDDVREVEDMVLACRARLARPGLGQAERVAVSVNLAHALAARSSLQGHPDGLAEATGLLAAAAASGLSDPRMMFRAASGLAVAMELRAWKHRDTRGWAEALRLLEGALRVQSGDADMTATTLILLADYDVYRWRTGAVTDAVARSRAAAIGRLREAIRVGPPGSFAVGLARLTLASLANDETCSDEELDEAIGLCRAAHTRFGAAAVRRMAIAPGVLLAALLVLRVSRGVSPASVDDDTREAAHLCWRALRDDRGAPEAAYGLAGALIQRETHGLPALRRPRRELPGDIPTAFRRAFFGSRSTTGVARHLVALRWADWARGRGDAEELAEALWNVVVSVPEASMRGFGRASREDVVTSANGAAAEAGFWLSRVGRTRDAVVALEYGRATLFTGPARYADPDLRAMLARAGRLDLWSRWLDAAVRLDRVHRAQYAAATSAPTVPPVGAVDAVRTSLGPFVSATQQAWSAYDHALHEIERVTGFRVHDRPPTYEMVRGRAGDDVFVYLACTRHGGYALVMDPSREPVRVDLPGFDAVEIDRLVRRCLTVRARRPELWPGVLDELLDRLDHLVMDRLRPVLQADNDICLVPIGLVGLLPLHAVDTAATDPASVPKGPGSGRCFRYAPNLRVAAVARDIAARTSALPARALVAGAGVVPGMPALTSAARESELVRRTYGAAGGGHPAARKTDVLRAMPLSTIWHFACHGVADAAEPLDSAIVLADGRLTLREILTLPAGEHRLAVLSSCDTDLPDLDLVDEVVSFPGGLLRAGVAGVVASQWPVDDTAAALLMGRFHTLVLSGERPDRALLQAQRWLRDADNATLRRCHPDLVSEPTGLPAAALDVWRRRAPFRHPRYWASFTFTGA
jgi:hypothetical protein